MKKIIAAALSLSISIGVAQAADLPAAPKADDSAAALAEAFRALSADWTAYGTAYTHLGTSMRTFIDETSKQSAAAAAKMTQAADDDKARIDTLIGWLQQSQAETAAEKTRADAAIQELDQLRAK